MFQFAQRKRGGTHGCKRELRVLNNEVWLEVQERFIQDHQDFGRAIGEAFKLVWIKRPQLSVEGVQEKIEVKSKYELCQIRTRVLQL